MLPDNYTCNYKAVVHNMCFYGLTKLIARSNLCSLNQIQDKCIRYLYENVAGDSYHQPINIR